MRAGLLKIGVWLVFAAGLASHGVAAAEFDDVLSGDGNADAWLEQEEEFLPVDEAFVLSAEVGADGAVLAKWEMPDGYYLYRHRFEFSTRGSGAEAVALGDPEIPPGKAKYDDFFGDVEVYYHNAQARVPVSGGGLVEVGIGYQGCADAGLCYPPETRWVALEVGGAGSGTAIPPAASSPTDSAPAVGQTEEQNLAGLLTSASMLTALAIFFAAGIGLAFTPCVLPMVPILSSIIVGESESLSRARAFTLSLVYVLGMAVTYAILGVLMGVFGASLNLQAALQSPVVLSVFAVVFVALSLSMFGFYELRLPHALQNRLNALSEKQGGGKHLSVAVMGSLSSLVVSPCVSAPLAGALIYISTTGDGVLGGLALLALGLGMGVPLLLIGASGGHLLPRAGAWMDSVKAVFGVLLLGVAIWLLERVVPPSVTLALWAALAVGAGVYLGALDFSPRAGWESALEGVRCRELHLRRAAPDRRRERSAEPATAFGSICGRQRDGFNGRRPRLFGVARSQRLAGSAGIDQRGTRRGSARFAGFVRRLVHLLQSDGT